MARITDPTPELEQAWREWVQSRPEVVRKVAERFTPWTLYRINSGHRVTILGCDEGDKGVTVRVAVTGQFNKVLHDRQVFGISPDELVECELPGPDEELGAALTPEQVDENIDELRLLVRPDLWTRMPDGSIIRKGIN